MSASCRRVSPKDRFSTPSMPSEGYFSSSALPKARVLCHTEREKILPPSFS